MRKPVPTMSWPHDPTGALRGAAERGTGPWCDGADPLLHQRPRGFDRVEVVGVRRQEAHGGAGAFDQVTDLAGFVGGEIVHDDHIPAAQMTHQVTTHPHDEAHGVHRPPRRRQGQPAVHADRADEGQVVAPVHRPGFDQHRPARQPGVRPAHGEIRAGFVEKDQPPRVYPLDPLAERRAFGLDGDTILFRRSRSFFLKTYPVRCRARRMLDRCTRVAGAASRLYARVNSSVVRSGLSWTSRCSSGRSTGDCHPPALSSGTSRPVSRARCTQRTRVARPIPNVAATSVYRSVPSSYARTARSRRAVGYGLGMRVIDHKSILNSSELWG